ncbi:hypothetical protein MMC07_001081 [Pseudocyphellaria aurata]|nr:hypothetical protein [Pseudocyphellaria aurata]
MPVKETFPVVPWTANNSHLTHALFSVLQENRSLRKRIWPPAGELPSAAIRAGSCKLIAKILLKDEAAINGLLKDANALACYGTAVDNQIAKLESTWKKARDILGNETRPLNEESMNGGTVAIRGKWAEAKKICPWFFIMRDIMEDRVQDVDIGELEAVTNSETDVYLCARQRGDRKRRRVDDEMEDVQDDDIVENGEVQAVGNLNTLGAFNETPYTAAARFLLTPLQEAWSSLDIDSPDRTEYYELGEALKQVGAMRHERKRLQAAAKEETKRVEIRERFALKKVQLELEQKLAMRKLELEERKLALQEHQMGMGQTR